MQDNLPIGHKRHLIRLDTLASIPDKDFLAAIAAASPGFLAELSRILGTPVLLFKRAPKDTTCFQLSWLGVVATVTLRPTTLIPTGSLSY